MTHPTRWTAATVASATRSQLIQWLVWNDPNGCYTNEDNLTEFGRILSTDELRALALEQVST